MNPKQEGELTGKDLSKIEAIEGFLNTYSYNFGRVDHVEVSSSTSDHVLYRVNPFIPLEIQVKASKDP